MDNRANLIAQYQDLIKAFADPCEGMIYHYTSGEGLRGIIESSEIWLTNVAFVNDTTECRALQEEKRLFNINEFNNKYVQEEWKQFISESHTDFDTYITSFSSGEESLDQWRAYGNFRIGFEANKLIKRGFNIYKCFYSRDEIKDWILQKGKVKEWSADSLADDWKSAAAFNLIYAASKKYKNKYFMNEKEFRLIAISHYTWEMYPNSPSMYKNDPPIYYRDHSTYKFPVPYVKFYIEDKEEQFNNQQELPQNINQSTKEREIKESRIKEEKNKKRTILPIKTILIGPMVHQKEAEIACKILLKDKGYKNVIVSCSEIPYRGF